MRFVGRYFTAISCSSLLQSLLRQEELRQSQRNAIRPGHNRQVRLAVFHISHTSSELTTPYRASRIGRVTRLRTVGHPRSFSAVILFRNRYDRNVADSVADNKEISRWQFSWVYINDGGGGSDKVFHSRQLGLREAVSSRAAALWPPAISCRTLARSNDTLENQTGLGRPDRRPSVRPPSTYLNHVTSQLLQWRPCACFRQYFMRCKTRSAVWEHRLCRSCYQMPASDLRLAAVSVLSLRLMRLIFASELLLYYTQ